MIAPLLAQIIDWHSFFFTLFALVACLFAAGVVFSNNIVRMAFYLTISLGATAGLFFLAGAEFVGSMQLLIYVGGTLVLLIFGVMLTARDAFISMKTRPADWVLGVLVGGGLLVLLLIAAFTVPDWWPPEDWAQIRDNLPDDITQDTTRIGLALTGPRIDGDGQTAGLSGYLLPFEIVSVHLLVVLIGAGYLARTKRRRTGVPAEAAEAGVAEKVRVTPTWVVLVILLAGDAFFTGAGVAGAVQGTFESSLAAARAADWFLPGITALFALRGLCLLCLLLWQRWGYYGMVLFSLLQPVAIFAGLSGPIFKSALWLTPLVLGGGLLLANLIVLAVVYYLLTKLGRPTMWGQLE